MSTTTFQALQANAVAVPLNDPSRAAAICASLEARSPFVDPRGEKIHVTELLWKHLVNHDAGAVQTRSKRVNWVEPTIVSPQEIRENKRGWGPTFIGCYRGFYHADPARCQFFVVVADYLESSGRLIVVTTIPLRRPRDVEAYRKEVLLWSS